MPAKHHEDLATLIELFDASEWQELSLKIDDLELFLSNDPKAKGLIAREPTQPKGADTHTAPPERAASIEHESSPQATSESGPEDGQVVIRAGNVGTFYRSPKPGEPPYVAVGDTVTPDTEVCLIEVMKLFTPQQAGVDGVIRTICIKDTQMVEYDQPLFYVEVATNKDS